MPEFEIPCVLGISLILVTQVCVGSVRHQTQVQDTGSEGNRCAVQCWSGCQQLKNTWIKKVLSFF